MNRTHCSARPTPRRGIAMMLVVVAIAVGTVVAAATLMSNDNASVIGRNTVEASNAKWSGHAASEMVIAAMQTETAWETIMSGDMLIEDWSVGGSTVDVRVTDMDGNPATTDDREILVHVTTAAGVTTERLLKQVSRSTETIFGDEIDPELGEFAVFAAKEGYSDEESSIGVWRHSPAASLRSEVKLGTGAFNAAYFWIETSPKLGNLELYVFEDSSNGLKKRINSSPYTGGRVIPEVVPVVPNYLPPDDLSVPTLGRSVNFGSGTSLFPESGQYESTAIYSKGVLEIDGSVSPVVGFGDLVIATGGALRVRGDARVFVTGNLIMQSQGAIELEEGATLELYVGTSVQLDGAAIGVPYIEGGEPVRTPDEIKEYRAAGDMRLYSLAEAQSGVNNPSWTIENGSLVLGSIHAPHADVLIRGGSTLIGRATSSRFELNESRLCYDPALDNRTGFTDPKSPMWDNGDVRAEYVPAIELLKIVSTEAGDLTPVEALLVKEYACAEDKSAYLRWFTSEMLGVAYTSTNDANMSVFDDLATAMSDELGMTTDEIETELNTLLNGIDSGHSVEVSAVEIAGETIGSLLNAAEGLIKGALGGGEDTDSPPVIATTDRPKVDVAKPDADGNFTIRRESKARARTVNELADHFEDRR